MGSRSCHQCTVAWDLVPPSRPQAVQLGMLSIQLYLQTLPFEYLQILDSDWNVGNCNHQLPQKKSSKTKHTVVTGTVDLLGALGAHKRGGTLSSVLNFGTRTKVRLFFPRKYYETPLWFRKTREHSRFGCRKPKLGTCDVDTVGLEAGILVSELGEWVEGFKGSGYRFCLIIFETADRITFMGSHSKC